MYRHTIVILYPSFKLLQMRYMLERGLDVHQIGLIDLLHELAAQQPGTPTTVASAELLISSGCFVDASRSSDWRTPLHCAVAHGSLSMAATLLQLGADVNAVAKVRTLSSHEHAAVQL